MPDAENCSSEWPEYIKLMHKFLRSNEEETAKDSKSVQSIVTC